ncbi:Y-family DNA polymerase [Methylobacterium nigriterrae]|uniref:Y-family DNA polymerase n=1 Tax=Methylobacterium nigriterrae TaxID=3127512 RepID=UPI003013D3C8
MSAEPLVLVEQAGGASRLAAVNRQAMDLGLRRGQTLADARACIPDLQAFDHDPAADAALLGRMAASCERWTPLVALDPPDGLILDVTGCDHLAGGEAALRGESLDRFRRAGFATRATIAGTPDAARALARFGRAAVVPPGGEAAAIRPLPVVALGLPADTGAALSLAGLKRLGDLADLPSLPLAARFGEDLATRLRRVQGREDRRITPLRPRPACWADQVFAEPIAHRPAVELALQWLASAITRQLEAAGEGGRAFEASFFRSDGAVRRIGVRTGRPQRDAATVLRLLRERLDALTDPLDPGYGFDRVRLIVPAAEPLNLLQPRLDGGTDSDDTVSDLVDRLVARLGSARVLRFAAADTHDPLRSSRLVPAADAPARPMPWPVPEPCEPPARPLYLFDPPQVIETLAEVPDGPPLRFRWQSVLHTIVHSEGPERIAPEWWREAGDAPTRDYYRVEDAQGHRFWLFRAGLYGRESGRPRWYLHGLFP